MIGRALNGIERVASVATGVEITRVLVGRAASGAARAYRGTTALAREANGSRGRAIVSGGLWHSIGDRERALAQISTDFATFLGDVKRAAGNGAGSAAAREWIAHVVEPVALEWAQFAEGEARSWAAKAVTSWETFEGWLERLRRLREAARMMGLPLTSPEPIELPTTIWQRGERGEGSAADILWTLLKAIVYAAIGITGVTTLYSALRDIRGRARGEMHEHAP